MLWFFKHFGWHLLFTIWTSFFSPSSDQVSLLNEEYPVVEIPSLGSVRGAVKLSDSGRKYFSYRGVPYAEPPIGDLRFKDPVPASPWIGQTFDGTREGPVCVQYFSFLHFSYGVEDCLRLNVYTPVKTSNELLPVMVWIHGGGFTLGSGNGETELYGPEFLMDRDIVLVTINYRLGAIGFLSTEDAEAPGNYGLLDQSLALKWVRDHVKAFGGDPSSITIFGESAGGASVEYQVLSPYNKGVFHKAIAQSGSTTATWAHQPNKGVMAQYTKNLAIEMGCPVGSSSEIVTCLKTKRATDIANYKKKISIPLAHELFPNPFVPRVDKERENPFLPDNPINMITSGRFNSVPFMTGANENEGVILSMSLFFNRGRVAEAFKDDPITNIRYMLNMEMAPKGEEIARQVFDYYLDKDKPYIGQHKQFERMFSDSAFYLSIDRATRAMSRYSQQPVFRYHYAHHGFMSIPRMLGMSPHIDFGVGHADELFLLFKNKLAPPMSKEDKLVSTILLDLWTSFAKDGVPSSSLIAGDWLPYHADDSQKHRYLLIGDAAQPGMLHGDMPFSDRLNFLQNVL